MVIDIPRKESDEINDSILLDGSYLLTPPLSESNSEEDDSDISMNEEIATQAPLP